jgi:hypothetical protein
MLKVEAIAFPNLEIFLFDAEGCPLQQFVF